MDNPEIVFFYTILFKDCLMESGFPVCLFFAIKFQIISQVVSNTVFQVLP